MMLPWFLADVRGHSPMYTRVEDGPWGGGAWGWAYMALTCVTLCPCAAWAVMLTTHSAAFFLVFTDFCIYWVHRIEHHPSIYRHLHKRHHKWVSESLCHALPWTKWLSDAQSQLPSPPTPFTRSTATCKRCPITSALTLCSRSTSSSSSACSASSTCGPSPCVCLFSPLLSFH